MLTIIVQTGAELFDEETGLFFNDTEGDVVLELEHSLVSLSKWESKFQKPFLGKDEKTAEEILGYVEMMILSPFPPNIIQKLSQTNISEINEYIESKQSATTFGKMPERRSRGETITSELIYYWLVAFNIPFECQHWHLNRLFALIRICNIKQSKPEKRSKNEIARERRELNEQRKAQLGTAG